MGRITVNIHDESRLAAILALSRAMENLTKALSATASVEISDCMLVSKGEGVAGVVVNTAVSDFVREAIEIEDDEVKGDRDK